VKSARVSFCVTLSLASFATGPLQAQRLQLAPSDGLGYRGSGVGYERFHPTPNPQPPIPSQVVVRFRSGVSGERQGQLIGTSGCRIARSNPGSGYALIQVRDGRAGDLIRLLGQRSEVLSAEPCYRLHLVGTSLYDPYEWYLYDHGTVSANAPSNFGIEAASAWSLTQGAGVTVAIVDSGAAFENYSVFHAAPDLSHTQFTAGYDILAANDHPDDDNGHGTHVAGILAGSLDNGGGIKGVAPQVTLMPVKVMGPDGSGSDYDIAQGIRWAADHGAQVINMSLGGPDAGSVLADACKYAASMDCVLVVAAGNENAAQVDYPAGYTWCTAVGATGFDGVRAPYSNRGRNLEVVAPGGNMSQDLNGDGKPDGIVAQTFDPQQGYDQFHYEFWEGTSMATPMVSGVAALVRAANPSLSAMDVRAAIRDTALRLGGTTGRNNNYGYGLVDALAAVKAALAQQGQ
jgi:serine protease